MTGKVIAELLAAADPARQRVALPMAELSDEDMVLIAQSKVPVEHDYEYEDDPSASSDRSRSDRGFDLISWVIGQTQSPSE